MTLKKLGFIVFALSLVCLKNTTFCIVHVYYIYVVYRFIRDLLIIIYCVLFVKTVWGSDIRRVEHN